MNDIQFPVTKADLRIEWFSGQGAGGQHRNKHQNCCRIIHVPSGLSALSQEHRDRPSNQRKAFMRLAERLVSAAMADDAKERYGTVETIRTYHEARNMVKDHASGFTQTYAEVVGKPYIDDMVDARRFAIAAALPDPPQ